jgi:hypothetical protein
MESIKTTDAKTGRRRMAKRLILKIPVPSGEPYYINADKIQRIVTNYEVLKVHDSSRCYLILDGDIAIPVELPIEKVIEDLCS